jgi:hypothetical protein
MASPNMPGILRRGKRRVARRAMSSFGGIREK